MQAQNPQQTLPSQYLAIDEEGFPLFDELRINDAHKSIEILTNLTFASNGAFQTHIGGRNFLVEAFDEPLIVQHIQAPNSNMKMDWTLRLHYGINKQFLLKTLSLDEWDRFHGMTTEGVPFVLSAKAQDEFFSQLDEYSDDTITFREKVHDIPKWFQPNLPIEKESFWTKIYQTESTPKWDLGKPTPALVEMLGRIKFPKSRVLVLGCGAGHDAALFAEKGHVVTAVDISPEAIARAKKNYGQMENLHLIQADIFDLPKKMAADFEGQFDLVFEHTCYCAIHPDRRNDLVKLWRQALHSQGQLLGVFFSMERRHEPPFGGSEWELRERFKKGFQFIFWGRYRNSIDRRNGKELIIFAKKR